MFEKEKAQTLELPAHPFDACIAHVRQVDEYQTVLLEDVRYSVPKPVAFETVTVKAYLNQIVIVHKGVAIARHARIRTPGEQVLEPMHYLSVLGRKPAYLDKTKLFTEWKLPATFARLRAALEAKHGPRTGARHYIRVLQLLTSHSVDTVESAIVACEHRQTLTAEIIAEKLNSLGARPSTGAASITMARTRLVAALLGLRFDDLRNREIRRRQAQVLAAGVLSIALAAGFGSLSIYALWQRNLVLEQKVEMQRQRDEADRLRQEADRRRSETEIAEARAVTVRDFALDILSYPASPEAAGVNTTILEMLHSADSRADGGRLQVGNEQ